MGRAAGGRGCNEREAAMNVTDLDTAVLCASVNLFNTLRGVRDGEVEVSRPILARGKVR
jgi:hypothetical protein